MATEPGPQGKSQTPESAAQTGHSPETEQRQPERPSWDAAHDEEGARFNPVPLVAIALATVVGAAIGNWLASRGERRARAADARAARQEAERLLAEAQERARSARQEAERLAKQARKQRGKAAGAGVEARAEAARQALLAAEEAVRLAREARKRGGESLALARAARAEAERRAQMLASGVGEPVGRLRERLALLARELPDVEIRVNTRRGQRARRDGESGMLRPAAVVREVEVSTRRMRKAAREGRSKLGYAAQLVPIAFTLARNPLVRELVVSAIMRRGGRRSRR